MSDDCTYLKDILDEVDLNKLISLFVGDFIVSGTSHIHPEKRYRCPFCDDSNCRLFVIEGEVEYGTTKCEFSGDALQFLMIFGFGVQESLNILGKISGFDVKYEIGGEKDPEEAQAKADLSRQINQVIKRRGLAQEKCFIEKHPFVALDEFICENEDSYNHKISDDDWDKLKKIKKQLDIYEHTTSLALFGCLDD